MRLAAAALPGCDAIAVTIAALATGAGPARGAVYGLTVLAAMAAAGTYRHRIGGRVSDQAGRLAAAAALSVFVVLPWTPVNTAMWLAGGTAGLVIALRFGAQAGLQAARRRGLATVPALIVGDGPQATEIFSLLHCHPELGLRPCGLLAGGPVRSLRQTRAGSAAGPAALGRLSEAAAVLDRFGVGQVLLCGGGSQDELAAVIQACRDRQVPVSALPQLPRVGLAVPVASLDEISATPLLPLRPGPGGRIAAAAKRGLDLVAGSALAIATAPLTLTLAAAVRLDLRLPPLFRQVRVVGRGREATITKLRTLRPDGDPDTTWVIPAGQCSRLGRVLRGSHADELPQLLSVLRGDMSLVGPRPERPHFARQLRRAVPGYAGRERVRGGLTGWAQVHGLTGDTSIEDRARFDNFAIEYWSLWSDLMVLARTVPAALRGALAKEGSR
jgi:lipopolysaccharide/colanic/teichoic acid biosynthesis glycosyltransferase